MGLSPGCGNITNSVDQVGSAISSALVAARSSQNKVAASGASAPPPAVGAPSAALLVVTRRDVRGNRAPAHRLATELPVPVQLGPQLLRTLRHGGEGSR